MSNGNNPNDPTSGEMKKMTIRTNAEGYGESFTEWLVPEELLRPYAIAYNAAIAAAGVEISKAIYEKLLEDGVANAETMMAPQMLSANKK